MGVRFVVVKRKQTVSAEIGRAVYVICREGKDTHSRGLVYFKDGDRTAHRLRRNVPSFLPLSSAEPAAHTCRAHALLFLLWQIRPEEGP